METGYFLFSLDFELATGAFDHDNLRGERFSRDGVPERRRVKRLVDLFEAYHIVGTWATVGHLFFEKCEYCENCSLMDWKGKYTSFEEAYGTNNPLWYASDLIDYLINKGQHQEIGFHGHSHRLFGENLMSPDQARLEIQEWKRVAKRKGVTAQAVVFPRHMIGHLKMLSQEGMLCYRHEPDYPAFYRSKPFGKYLKGIDQMLGLTKMPVYDLVCEEDQGLVRLYSSQFFFELTRKASTILDRVNLHTLALRRITQGIKTAARQKKMVHLWAHPWNFRSEKDFEKLEYVFAAVSEEVNAGRMRSVGMTEMAKILLQMDKRSPIDSPA